MLARRDPSSAATITTKTEYSFLAHEGPTTNIPSTRQMRNRNNRKRRFSDEQVRSLESMFEAETRPELRLKQQLATELGLQPRQVAIWFQNKRARSKSKSIEQEYSVLKGMYDAMATKFDNLKKENQSLLSQLQRLRNLMGKSEIQNCEVGQTSSCIDGEYDNTDTNSEAEDKTDLIESNNLEAHALPCSDTREKLEYVSRETDFMNTIELLHNGSLTSPSGDWCSFQSSFDTNCLMDYTGCSLNWWDL